MSALGAYAGGKRYGSRGGTVKPTIRAEGLCGPSGQGGTAATLNPEFRVVDNQLLFGKSQNKVSVLPQKKLLPPVDIGAIRTNIH